MNLAFKSAKLIGPSSNSSKCQIFESDQLTLLLYQKDQSGFNLHTNIASLFFESFKESYSSQKSSSVLQNLKEALGKTLKLYKDHEIAFGVLVLNEGTAYLGVRGEVDIYLLRHAKLANLLTGKPFVLCASGELKENDTFLLTTKDFFHHQASGVFKAALAKEDVGQGSQMLAPLISRQSGQGASLIKVSKSSALKSNFTNSTNSTSSNLYSASSKVKRSLLTVIDYVLKFLPEKSVYIGDIDPSFKVKKSARRAAFLGVMLMLILGISIFFGIRRAKTNQEFSELTKKITEITHVIDEAKSLESLNPTRARVLILQAQAMAKELQKQTDNPKIDDLEKQINSQIENIAGLYQVEPTLFLDLSLVSSGMEAQSITLSTGRMLVLDKSARKVVSINIENKKTQVVAGPTDLPSARGITAYVNRNFALTDEGIFELISPVRKVLEKDWQEAVVLAYTGNMYVLDKAQKVINRYSGDSVNFSNKVEWLSADSFPEGEIKSLAIDGAVWVLAGNDLYKYLSGVKDSFYLKGVNSANFDYFYTDEEASDLYLLDKENSHILVFDKTGAFSVEYKTDLLKETNNFVVSQKDKKLIFTAGSKLYSIDLKHF